MWSNHINLHIIMKKNTDVKREERNVSFNNRVAVVLIPERREIKEAKCDLWWSRNDFSSFQQSAHNEIRLYAMYENVNCREAKNLLYQPSENDLRMCDESTEELEEGWEMTMRRSSEDAIEVPEPQPKLGLMRHVDSVTLLSDYESKKHLIEETQTQPKVELAPSVAKPVQPRKRLNSDDDPLRTISLCVISPEYEDLQEKESICDPSNRKNRDPNRIDQSSGFAVVCGLFSFTLPILGYYLMHYSS